MRTFPPKYFLGLARSIPSAAAAKADISRFRLVGSGQISHFHRVSIAHSNTNPSSDRAPLDDSALRNYDSSIPEYPYGPARWFKQQNSGLYGGAVRKTGLVRTKGRNKGLVRRVWKPNVQKRKLWSVVLGRWIPVKVTAKALRTIDKDGGLDRYLLKDTPGRIKQLGLRGWLLRHRVLNWSPEAMTSLARESCVRQGLSPDWIASVVNTVEEFPGRPGSAEPEFRPRSNDANYRAKTPETLTLEDYQMVQRLWVELKSRDRQYRVRSLLSEKSSGAWDDSGQHQPRSHSSSEQDLSVLRQLPETSQLWHLLRKVTPSEKEAGQAVLDAIKYHLNHPRSSAPNPLFPLSPPPSNKIVRPQSSRAKPKVRPCHNINGPKSWRSVQQLCQDLRIS